jgi:hypothetical protein
MCVTAIVAAVAISAVSTVAAIDNANYQAKMMELQLQEQRDALRLQAEGAELQGLEQQVGRMQELNRWRAMMLANSAKNTGMGQNVGLGAIEDDAQKKLRYDLTNIRFNTAGEKNRIFKNIRSTRFQSQINSANRKSAVVGSLLNFASTAAQGANTLSTYSTPGTTTPATGGASSPSPNGFYGG